jgi:hypothetical protein
MSVPSTRKPKKISVSRASRLSFDTRAFRPLHLFAFFWTFNFQLLAFSFRSPQAPLPAISLVFRVPAT